MSAYEQAAFPICLTSTTVALLAFETLLVLLECPVFVRLDAPEPVSLTSPLADLFLPASALWGDSCPFTCAPFDCSLLSRADPGEISVVSSGTPLAVAVGLPSLCVVRLSAC